MSVAASTSQGVIYYVRVLPDTATYTDTGTVEWGSSARSNPLLVLAADVQTTPGWLTVTVSNGTPGDTVAFAIDGGMAVFGTSLDVQGQVIATTIPLGELSVGSHLLMVSTPTLEGFAIFHVLNPTPAYPIRGPVGIDPVPIIQTGVVKWVLQDAIPGGEQYIFAINQIGRAHV